MEICSTVKTSTQLDNSQEPRKVTAADLSHFLLDPTKVFARKIFAEREIKAGKARLFGIFTSNGKNEDLYVLERI